MIHRMFGALALACLVAACGGGGGGGDPAPAPAPTTAEISGIAATGAPFAGATVTIYDRNGLPVKSKGVEPDGSYVLEIPLSTPAPLVVEAVREDTTLVSTFAETRTTRLNITPLTNLVAARLSPDGDPRSLRRDPSAVTPQRLEAEVEALMDLLDPLMDAVGDDIDPLTGTFTADGTGHDRVLDSLTITIRPSGDFSNIEIAVRSAAEIAPLQFTSSSELPAPLPAIDTATLAPVGVAQLIADLTARMTTCYGLPLEERVSGATSSSTAVTGDASSVIAPACRTLFVGDDPASYLNNGFRVGRDSSNNGAFTGLFRRGATGVVFEQGQLEFLRSNPEQDLVFSYRTRDTAGALNYDTLIARNVNGVLKLIGNQYIYNARVRPWVLDREFLNQPQASYMGVGYNVWIANAVAGGSPVFSKVEVTDPKGRKFTFRPQAGRSELSAVKSDGSLSNSSVLMLASRFKSASTPGSPSGIETGFNWAAPAYTEDQITEIPEQGVWTMEFFHADAGTPNVIQRHRTISRAPTLAEAALMPRADLTPAAKDEIRADTSAFGAVIFPAPSASAPNVADLSTAGGGDFWLVPEGATAPATVSVYGRGPDPDGSGPLRGPNFDDRVTVAATARKALITCTKLSAGDTHCDNSTGVNQYAQGSIIFVLELFAVQRRGIEMSTSPAFWYPFPR